MKFTEAQCQGVANICDKLNIVIIVTLLFDLITEKVGLVATERGVLIALALTLFALALWLRRSPK